MTVLLVYTIAGILSIALGVLVYVYALSTRRRVHCRACGETVDTEHDHVHHCPSCGGPL